MARRGSVGMQCETMGGMAVHLVTTGGSAELPWEMLEGVTRKYPATGGTVELKFRMLQESCSVVSYHWRQ